MKRIRAQFQKMLDAQKAIKELKTLGYTNARLDAIDGNMSAEYSEEINALGTRNSQSLSALVLKSRSSMRDASKGSLAAANPMVSGMGIYDEISDNMSTSLLVNVDEANTEEVNKILKDMGGRL